MKQLDDKLTLDVFDASKTRGRPITGNAKSNAQRMREYRQRKKTLDESSLAVIDRQVQLLEIQLREAYKKRADLYRQQKKGDL